jgi:hypothetical protein
MILVECNPDEYLVSNLGFSKKKIKHEGGKGKVVGKLTKMKRAIGIIDEDPDSTQPGELSNYIDREVCGNLKLLQNRDDGDKLIIQISPKLEGWILLRAKYNEISPKDFNLPEDPEKLHSITRIERKDNFQRFLKKLLDSNDDELNKMREWLTKAIS